MPYKIKENINDTRIAVSGRNQEQFFTDAFLAIMYMLKPVQKFSIEKVERELVIDSMDSTALLADFINSILSLADKNKEYYTHLIFYKINPSGLRVRIFGISVESFQKTIDSISDRDFKVNLAENGSWETVIILRN